MTARSEDRGVQVEARTLSGEHIGQRVQVPEQWDQTEPERWQGTVLYVGHQEARTMIRLEHNPTHSFVQTYDLAPTDLVTVTDGGAEA